MSGWPRGPRNELHIAAGCGSTECTAALLSDGSIDIDQGDPEGMTPLVYSCNNGYVRVARLLLREGANVSIADDGRRTTLHQSAVNGHIAVTKLLVRAGAELEAPDEDGHTPLHLCSQEGHTGVMIALLEAGANPNSKPDRATPLSCAAAGGQVDAIKVLLRANANPLLAPPSAGSGGFRTPHVPLDFAVMYGQADVVRELIQQVGIEGCGGESGGVQALRLAAAHHTRREGTDIMTILIDAGVVDTGHALCAAAGRDLQALVKLLLQRQQQKKMCEASDGIAYVNARVGFPYGTPLFAAIAHRDMGSHPRVVRLLVDAGADTTSAGQLTDSKGQVVVDAAPLVFANHCLGEKKAGVVEADEQQLHEEQLHGLEAIRRLLMRVEAIHAVSWLWARGVPPIADSGTDDARQPKKNSTAGTPLTLALPILRRRVRERGVLLARLFRYSAKPYQGPEAELRIVA